MKQLFLAISLLLYSGISAQMTQISNFGTNPGNLDMLLFEPSNPKANAEVVLVLHGCLQDATSFAEQTAWNVLAEEYGFYTIFAQQNVLNNPSKCFNWFLGSDNVRNEGEAKSLFEMIQYIHHNYAVDTSANYVCGLSAGAYMSTVMMACYPNVFKSGGTWAGGPYLAQASHNDTLSPTDWGNKVRNVNPFYGGKFPSLFVCHGTADNVVAPINESYLVAQWTNVHSADQQADHTNTFINGNPNIEENIYTNLDNDTIVMSYTIAGMGHGIAVDPGSGLTQGGVTAQVAFDVDFYSTYWMANFFKLFDNVGLSVINDTEDLKIKITSSTDGSVHITNDSDLDSLKIYVYDMLGRNLLKKTFRKEMNISPSEIDYERTLAICITDKNNHKKYSTVVIRK